MTALAFFSAPGRKLLLLAGEGCYLKVFDTESKLIRLCKVYDDQTVHGIEVHEDVKGDDDLQVVIWGGSSLTLLRKKQFDELLSHDVSNIQGFASLATDWILDIAISPYDTKSCALITAHNTVLRASLTEHGRFPHLETLQSPSPSILYSAHLVWESEDLILVAAGTVFGEIIAWDCSLPTGSALLESRVLATLTGHEGSIFGVHISPPTLDSTGSITRLLASCSDDRTIRIWDIYGAAKISREQEVAGRLGPRETGFGPNDQGRASDKAVDQYLVMVMGHASRIWRVKFFISQQDKSNLPSVNILSFGEDATAQQWALSLAPDLFADDSSKYPARLTHSKTFAFHSGKHIWSAVVRHLGDSQGLLATGGADGKISFYDISLAASEISGSATRNNSRVPKNEFEQSSENVGSSRDWDLEEILDVLPAKLDSVKTLEEPTAEAEPVQQAVIEDQKPKKKAKVKKTPKDAFNRYAFVSETDLLLTTRFSRVLHGQISSVTTWDEVNLPKSGTDDLKSYSIVKGVPELGLALLAGSNGKIYLYSCGSAIRQIAQVERKVADVFTLFDPETRQLDFVVTILGTGSATLFTLHVIDTESAEVLNSVSIDLPTKFVVTSVGKGMNTFVLGSRNGSLAVYNKEHYNEPVSIWDSKVGGAADAITSISFLTANSEGEKKYFLTTGRDGAFAIFAVIISGESPLATRGLIYPVHRGTPPLGPNIEVGWFNAQDLLLNGFKSQNFIVWNETQQCEIMSVECGGAHRSYAYSHLSNGGGYFVYTKASKLYLHTQHKPSHQIVKPGGHGREIKSCAVSLDNGLIATGAEDTAIRIWQYQDGESPLDKHLNCLVVLQKHTAGIQYLQWHGSKYLFSSGGNEEFFIWAIEQIPEFGVGIVCEAICPDQSEERDLRIMSFDVTEIAGAKVDADLLISLAYSDSTIRTYMYSRTKKFSLVGTGKYTSSCLVQIRHIEVLEGQLRLLTAATDGSIVLWSCSISGPLNGTNVSVPQLLKLSSHKLHQSSIKCLDVRIYAGYFVIATGGDDNALGITIYSLHQVEAAPKSIILRSAHAAAITGLCFVSGSEDINGLEQFRIVSSGNDQRVKEWSVSIIDQDMTLEIKKVGDVFTSVADVGDLAPLMSDMRNIGGPPKVLVVGNGMEVFSVSSLT